MGTWGTGPFDNDAAADMIAKLQDPIHKVGGRRHAKYDPQSYYGEARAAIQFLLISHGTDILGGHSLVPSLKALEKMRADKEWIESWSEPNQIKRALDKEIAAVRKIVKKCCGLSDEERRKRFGRGRFKFRRLKRISRAKQRKLLRRELKKRSSS